MLIGSGSSVLVILMYAATFAFALAIGASIALSFAFAPIFAISSGVYVAALLRFMDAALS
jgi:hypothetical protein